MYFAKHSFWFYIFYQAKHPVINAPGKSNAKGENDG